MAVITDSTTVLVPAKFVLIFLQGLLLVVMIDVKEDYLYAKVGQKYDPLRAENTFFGVVICWAAFLVIEFFSMLIGFPVANAFATNNFI